ncbi:MAG: acyl-CoA dehydrogenase [Acidiferrobacterales bacterium]
MTIIAIVIALIVAIGLLYVGRGYWAWVVAIAMLLAAWAISGIDTPLIFTVVTVVAAAVALAFGLPVLRRRLISTHLMRRMAAVLPRLGDTERVALEAGTVWWDGDLFSGTPDWRKLLDFQPQPLSPQEREFIDGPVEQLCRTLDDWEINQNRQLPDDVWDFLRKHRFFGMIIPKEYGGLGFSAIAHSTVVTKIASRSITVAVTVMVPNSLGPAELLLHYGTEEQKRHYLPRLAKGEDIPCFALTGPEAGSDAAATQSTGVVMRGRFDGEETLGICLNWRKRYITLAPVATVIGLAFRLQDPDGLLGDSEDLGITCALIPRDLPGIDIGKLHDPMGIPFYNGPIVGRDVFVPLDFIIGGRQGAGQGWRMLMESLAAGRSISLPALSVGAAELATRLVGAYATVREQFDTPIGRFEGIEEPLARIGGHTYLMNAARVLTCGAIDDGARPAVLSAIVKAYLTEGMRSVITDAMDIRAGAGICRGPRNVLARTYVSVPIGITVEGANILTRSMIIYGQGVIRCHPYVHDEIESIADRNLARFDRAIFGHISFVIRNIVRSLLLGLTASRLARPPVHGPLAKYFQQLTRYSAAFALVSDAAMGTLGGALKRREKISGRLADALAWMYLASAALKRCHDEARQDRDLPLVRWSCALALYRIQEALRGVLDNLPNRFVAQVLRPLVFPLGARLRPPTDKLGGAVARGLLEDREARTHLTTEIFVPPPEEVGLGHLEAALNKAVDAITVETKLRDAVRAGALERAPGDVLADNALALGIISQEERDRLREADEARDEVIQVDAFDPETYVSLRG